MRRQIAILVVLTLISLCGSGQDSIEVKLIGKWGVCYSLDSVDASCNKPFNYYTFEIGQRCQHGSIIISDKKIPVTGTWKYQNGTLSIVYDKHPNFSYPTEVFKEINFINEDLFYYKAIDKVEYPGHWVFYSFTRIK